MFKFCNVYVNKSNLHREGLGNIKELEMQRVDKKEIIFEFDV